MNIKQQKREIHDALVNALNQCTAVLAHLNQQHERACEKACENETDKQYENRRQMHTDIIELSLVTGRIINALNAF